MRLGTGRTSSPDESCFWAWLLPATCSPDQGWLSPRLQDWIHNHKQPHSDFRRHTTPRGSGAAGKNRAHYYPHYLFLTQHSKVCKGRSIIPFAFQCCNIYSKPEPLPVNALSEECHLLWGQCHGEIERRGRRRQRSAQTWPSPENLAVIIYTPCLMHSTCLSYKRRWVDWCCLPRNGPAESVSAILLTMTK